MEPAVAPEPDVCPGRSRTAALRCAACGSREPVRTPARLHGWQRCRHCGEVIVAPWSDAEAFEGPRARTVVLQLRGRAHFMVPRRTLLTTLELALWLFIVVAIAVAGVAGFEIEAAPRSAWRWLGPLLCLLAGGTLAALAARRWATVQHLEISPRRLVAWRSVGGRRFARVDRSLGSELVIAAEEGIETVSESRFRVRIRTGAADARPVDLVVPSRVEAEWVAALVRAAVADDAGVHRCPGCGAPVHVGLEERAGGHTECEHCGAGFVVDVRGIRWRPVVLPCPDAIPQLRPPARVEVRRGPGGEVRWHLRPDSLASRVAAVLGFLINVVFFGAFGGATVWLSQHTPPGAVGLTLLVLLCAVMLFAIAGFALALAALVLLGREVVGVDEARLWRAARVAGFTLPGEPRGATPGRGASPSAVRRMAGSALPIARLTRVELEREGLETQLRFHIPTRSLDIAWRLPSAEDRWLRRELALVLAERLRAVGREVVLRAG